MHTIKLKNHNIHYSPDLSGEIIINGNGDKLKTTADELTEIVKTLRLFSVSGSLLSDIRDEMDADMEDSGMAQGEIESCLTHWSNKYVIQRKVWFSNDR